MEASQELEEKIRHQYDRCLQIIMEKERADYFRKRSNLLDAEVFVDDLSPKDKKRCEELTKAMEDYTVFRVWEFEFFIRDIILVQALKNLPEWKRNLILMTECEEMTYAEYGRRVNRSRSTIKEESDRILNELRNILKGGQSDGRKQKNTGRSGLSDDQGSKGRG